MTFLSKIHKTTLGAVALGAALVLAPMNADALTIRLTETVTNDTISFSADPGDTTLNVVATGDPVLTFSDFIISQLSAGFSDMGVESELATVSLGISGGNAGSSLLVEVSRQGYGAGAGAPDISALRFDITGTRLSNFINATSYVDDSNLLFGQATQIGATISEINPTNNSGFPFNRTETGAVALTDPFSITQVIEVGAAKTGTTRFDATTIAAIPLPAGGILLLTALGGLAVMRRKRKAA